MSGGTRQGFERQGIDLDLGVREQLGGVVPQHDRVGEACRSTCEVGGLVQLRYGIVDVVVWPQRVEDFLAVQAPAGSEREELDQRSRLTAAPEALGHGATVDGDLESPEQPDCNLSHGSTSLNSDTLSHGRVRRRQCTPESTDAQVGKCTIFAPASCGPEVQPRGNVGSWVPTIEQGRACGTDLPAAFPAGGRLGEDDARTFGKSLNRQPQGALA